MKILGVETAVTSLGLVLALASGVLAGSPEEEAAAVSLAREALGKELHTAPEAFELESVESIGVSASGLRCRPLLAPGEGTGEPAWRVRLRRENRTFDVRVAGEEAVVCLFGAAETPRPAVGLRPSGGAVEGGLAEQTERARADLANRLSVFSDDVEVLEAVSVVWPDASAGCPQPKKGYAQVLTPGVRIRLKVGDRVYQYHARDGGVPSLCPNPSPVEPRRVEVE
jgi:hypothetical protein